MSQAPALLAMVFAGGFIGTIARHRLGAAVHARAGAGFPWGTLAVNVLGTFALGLLLPLLATAAPLTPLRAFVTVGLLGAFTTFSTLAYEAALLIAAGRRGRAAAYAAATLVLGMAGLVAGLLLGRALG